jgi:hypothetical protein
MLQEERISEKKGGATNRYDTKNGRDSKRVASGWGNLRSKATIASRITTNSLKIKVQSG